MSHYIDLTHSFTEDMPLFPGDAPAEIVWSAHLEKDGCNAMEIKTKMHTGTHIDAPFHMINGAKKLDEIPVEKLVGRGVLVDARGRSAIDAELLKNIELKKGDVVLVLTGHSNKFREPDYFEKYPFITEDFADLLIAAEINLVGVDTPSPDPIPYSIHKKLLGKEILILENLTNLESLYGKKDFRVFAFPPKVALDGSFVRVVAEIA